MQLCGFEDLRAAAVYGVGVGEQYGEQELPGKEGGGRKKKAEKNVRRKRKKRGPGGQGLRSESIHVQQAKRNVALGKHANIRYIYYVHTCFPPLSAPLPDVSHKVLLSTTM